MKNPSSITRVLAVLAALTASLAPSASRAATTVFRAEVPASAGKPFNLSTASGETSPSLVNWILVENRVKNPFPANKTWSVPVPMPQVIRDNIPASGTIRARCDVGVNAQAIVYRGHSPYYIGTPTACNGSASTATLMNLEPLSTSTPSIFAGHTGIVVFNIPSTKSAHSASIQEFDI